MEALFDNQTIRLINAVLAAVAAVLLSLRLTKTWRGFPPRMRLLALALWSLLLVGAYGSWEAREQLAPIGFRSYAAAVAYVWVIVALTLTPPLDDRE